MIFLIFKDILLQKKMLIFGFIYVTMMVFLFQEKSGIMLHASIIAVTYIMGQTSCANDDKSKSDLLYNSLPIGRSEIVFSKYVSMFVFALIGIIYYQILFIFIKLLGLEIIIASITIPSIMGALFSMSILNGIYLPIYYKVGFIKSKIVNMLLFVGLFILGPQIYMLKGKENLEIVGNLFKSYNELSYFWAQITMLVGLILALSVSYLLSLKFYSKREF